MLRLDSTMIDLTNSPSSNHSRHNQARFAARRSPSCMTDV